VDEQLFERVVELGGGELEDVRRPARWAGLQGKLEERKFAIEEVVVDPLQVCGAVCLATTEMTESCRCRLWSCSRLRRTSVSVARPSRREA
jgi:hypothetical protein